ncbi:MAG TPA: CdaR family protein [Candidatus Sulfotelmatobacter sp.]|nr:CdaR family protein [Candidatus Sulfotelmatobacter sp.]
MITFLKRYVFHNFGLKVLSLVLATGLWFIISRDEQPAEVAVRAPIVFEHVPTDLEISSESAPEALIRVRGPERVIRELRSNEVQAQLDLSGAKPQERTFELTAQDVRHPRDVSVMQIIPSQLHLTFDTRLTREIDVRPRIVGADTLPNGAQVVKVDIDPARITITGPRRHVEKIDSATTDPIDVLGTQGTGFFNVNVYVSDPLVQVVDPTNVRVTVVIQKVGAATAH